MGYSPPAGMSVHGARRARKEVWNTGDGIFTLSRHVR